MLKWAKSPIQRYVDFVGDSNRILFLCINGISTISNMVPLVEALSPIDCRRHRECKHRDWDNTIEETKKRAAFAQEEIDNGFPILISHAVVSLYSSLEIFIYDLARVWMINVPKVLENDHFSKIKIPLSEYELLLKEDRMDYLLNQYTKHINADMKLGVGKFEEILDSVSLSGSVIEEIRRDILELSQVRNIIVHRGGYVDRRFKEICPWISTDIGNKHVCRLSDYQRYRNSNGEYVAELIDRIRIYFGYEPYKKESDGT